MIFILISSFVFTLLIINALSFSKTKLINEIKPKDVNLTSIDFLANKYIEIDVSKDDRICCLIQQMFLDLGVYWKWNDKTILDFNDLGLNIIFILCNKNDDGAIFLTWIDKHSKYFKDGKPIDFSAISFEELSKIHNKFKRE